MSDELQPSALKTEIHENKMQPLTSEAELYTKVCPKRSDKMQPSASSAEIHESSVQPSELSISTWEFYPKDRIISGFFKNYLKNLLGMFEECKRLDIVSNVQ